MLPICFEWQWDLGHFIFMGLFYLALTTIGCGLIYTLIKTFSDLRKPPSHH